jgi:peptidoglycan hydrolase-like protein with peptidoglycan-binding domain
MFAGKDVLTVAEPHVGEQYVLGTPVPKHNPEWKGPWDCSEFASWCVWQAYRIVYGVNPPDIRNGKAYSGYWADDAASKGQVVEIGQAIATPGAILLRKPRRTTSGAVIGHVAISLGDGSTVEAHSSRVGVAIVQNAASRPWSLGILLPGVEYARSAATPYKEPAHLFQLANPYARGPEIVAIQRALLSHGIHAGGVDGIFGPDTDTAVIAFQTKSGLVVDGVVGKDTAEALGLQWPIAPSSDDKDEYQKLSTRKENPLTSPALTPSPAHDLELARTPNAGAPGPSGPAALSLSSVGDDYYAALEGGTPFYTSTRVRYRGRIGLYQPTNQLQRIAQFGVYDRTQWVGELGQWAHFLWPTIMAESDGYFARLNSYDRAAFTFGVYQFAAHTPRENLIELFRKLLALPNASRYFPDLKLRPNAAGKPIVTHVKDGAETDLEAEQVVAIGSGSETQIRQFMEYLNADGGVVDRNEQLAAARLMLWAKEDHAMNRAQLDLAVATATAKLKATAHRVTALQSVSDWRIWLWVSDIRHQGRAGFSAIANALDNSDPIRALSSIGAGSYDDRLKAVRDCVAVLESEKVLQGWKPV